MFQASLQPRKNLYQCDNLGDKMEAFEKVWFLAKEELIPDDYRTVNITSHRVDDPQGTRRFNSNGQFIIAKVWVADLERGGVKVESPEIWNHHPPLDVVIYHLEEEDFKRLLGRLPDSREQALSDSGIPKPLEDQILGNRFQG